MANIEVGVCGPVGARLSGHSLRDTLMTFAGGVGFVAFFSRFWRVEGGAAGSTLSLLFALGAGASAGVMAWGFARLVRRKDHWAIAQVGPLAFVLLLDLQEKVPAGSPWRVLAALLPLAPAGILIRSYVHMIRRADELQRRIVYEALAFAYVITLSVVAVGALLERAGVPKMSWLWIAGVLIFSWSIGLLAASRRYR